MDDLHYHDDDLKRPPVEKKEWTREELFREWISSLCFYIEDENDETLLEISSSEQYKKFKKEVNTDIRGIYGKMFTFMPTERYYAELISLKYILNLLGFPKLDLNEKHVSIGNQFMSVLLQIFYD